MGFLPCSCGGALVCWKTCFDGAAARHLLLTFMFDLCRYWSPFLVLMFTLSKQILLGSVSFGMNQQRTATYWKIFASIFVNLFRVCPSSLSHSCWFFKISNSDSQTSSNLAPKRNFFQSLTFQSILGAQKSFLRHLKLIQTYELLIVQHIQVLPFLAFVWANCCIESLNLILSNLLSHT